MYREGRNERRWREATEGEGEQKKQNFSSSVINRDVMERKRVGVRICVCVYALKSRFELYLCNRKSLSWERFSVALCCTVVCVSVCVSVLCRARVTN